MSDDQGHKTGRVAILSVVLLFMALFFFLFKIDACKKEPQSCKEEFVEFSSQGYSSDHKCFEGAVVEIVSAEHGGKAGIMCHCVNNMKLDAGR